MKAFKYKNLTLNMINNKIKNNHNNNSLIKGIKKDSKLMMMTTKMNMIITIKMKNKIRNIKRFRKVTSSNKIINIMMATIIVQLLIKLMQMIYNSLTMKMINKISEEINNI